MTEKNAIHPNKTDGFFGRLARARPTKPGEIYGVPGQGDTLLLSAGSIAVLFFVWWLTTYMGWVKPLFVPSPMTIAPLVVTSRACIAPVPLPRSTKPSDKEVTPVPP